MCRHLLRPGRGPPYHGGISRLIAALSIRTGITPTALAGEDLTTLATIVELIEEENRG